MQKFAEVRPLCVSPYVASACLGGLSALRCFIMLFIGFTCCICFLYAFICHSLFYAFHTLFIRFYILLYAFIRFFMLIQGIDALL